MIGTDCQPISTDCPDWPSSYERSYIDAGYWQNLTFCDQLAEATERYADRIALIDACEQLTFAAFWERVNRLAAGLSRRGLTAGENALIQISNRIAFAEIFFACMRIGVRPVLALPAHRELEIRRLCETARAVAYITEDDTSGFDYRPIARRVSAAVPTLRTVIIVGNSEEFIPFSELYATPLPTVPSINASDVACFQLSGGTTGSPKLIPRRHREYLYNTRAAAHLCGFNQNTTYLVALPAPHNFPLCCPGFVGTLLAGGRVVFAPNANPDIAFPLIRREGVTVTALVPPLALLWAEVIAAHGTADLTSLQLIQVGGAKLGIEAAKRVTALFPGCLQQVFGMAEGLVCYTRLDDPIDQVLGTQGRPLSPADEVRIVDSDDNDVAEGDVGAVLTRGPYTIRGYFRAIEHNRTAFTEDGFYRTGDLARRTPAGNLVIEGRDKDQINRGGEKISAEEIEDVVMAHPSVIDAAAVSVADATLGERICVYVIARNPAPTVADLKRHARDTGIATFKVPDRIVFVDAFPETGVGKTDRKALRQALQSIAAAPAAASPAGISNPK